MAFGLSDENYLQFIKNDRPGVKLVKMVGTCFGVYYIPQKGERINKPRRRPIIRPSKFSWNATGAEHDVAVSPLHQ